MGVPLNSHRRPNARGGSSKQRRARAAPRPAPSPGELYERGCAALFQEDFDAARDCLARACRLEPNNPEYLDTYGALLAEVGPQQEALTVLTRLVELQPDSGFEKYMYLGQLLEGDEAVAHIRKAVEVLDRELGQAQERKQQQQQAEAAGGGKGSDDDDGDEDEEDEVAGCSANLSAALCSLCELLLCGASDPDQVAAECEELLARAKAVCPDHYEHGQKLAALRMHQGRREEALDALRHSMSTWYRPSRPQQAAGGDAEAANGSTRAAAASAASRPQQQRGEEGGELRELGPSACAGSGDEESDGGEDDDDDDGDEFGNLPPFESRVEAVKLLLELDDTTQAALEVVETCLLEDEDSVEATFLLAVAHHAGGELDDAEAALSDAFELAMHQGMVEGHPGLEPLRELKAAIDESRGL